MSIQFTRLRRLRKEIGLSQEEVAARLGVSRQAVAKWEKGESLPDLESCVALADLYGTTVDHLARNLRVEEKTADGKHVFGVSRLNEKGQITLPAPCRRIFGLKPGDSMLILGDENRGIALIKIDIPAEPDDGEGDAAPSAEDAPPASE